MLEERLSIRDTENVTKALSFKELIKENAAKNVGKILLRCIRELIN